MSSPPIRLRPLRASDAVALLEMRARSRAEFQAGEPLRDERYFMLQQQHELIVADAVGGVDMGGDRQAVAPVHFLHEVKHRPRQALCAR